MMGRSRSDQQIHRSIPLSSHRSQTTNNNIKKSIHLMFSECESVAIVFQFRHDRYLRFIEIQQIHVSSPRMEDSLNMETSQSVLYASDDWSRGRAEGQRVEEGPENPFQTFIRRKTKIYSWTIYNIFDVKLLQDDIDFIKRYWSMQKQGQLRVNSHTWEITRKPAAQKDLSPCDFLNYL